MCKLNIEPRYASGSFWLKTTFEVEFLFFTLRLSWKTPRFEIRFISIATFHYVNSFKRSMETEKKRLFLTFLVSKFHLSISIIVMSARFAYRLTCHAFLENTWNNDLIRNSNSLLCTNVSTSCNTISSSLKFISFIA